MLAFIFLLTSLTLLKLSKCSYIFLDEVVAEMKVVLPQKTFLSHCVLHVFTLFCGKSTHAVLFVLP